MKKLITSIALSLCTIVLLAATRSGEPAPAFAATDLQGNRVSLADLKGSVVVIHFAASW